MPYFVYQINNQREYLYIEHHAAYREARQSVRRLRESFQGSGKVEFRMVFAADEAEALDLLRAPRERVPSEDD
jgi:hypothetical protein